MMEKLPALCVLLLIFLREKKQKKICVNRWKKKKRLSLSVSLTITAIKDNDGEITGFMCIAIDISERKKAEEDLRESLEKEKELSELKSRFVSMASHEFRTPVSTMLSSAYLIEKYTSEQDQPRREK